MALPIIDNLKGDVGIGAAVGLGLIFLNVLGLFSFALPPELSALATNVGRLLVVVIIAPILEEFFFRGLVQTFFMSVTNGKFILSAALQGLVFALFHLGVYSGLLLEAFEFSGVLVVGGAFISAFLFGFAMPFINRSTNNIITSIIPHAMINFWIVRGTLVII